MRPAGPDTLHTDCILIVGVSRPKLAAVFLILILFSLFLTFHVLYDSAVYNIKTAQAVPEHRLTILTNRVPEVNPGIKTTINHPVFTNRLHFPKTSRRLPQVIYYQIIFICRSITYILNILKNTFREKKL